MTNQLGDKVCDELRAEISQFLAGRPDLGIMDLIQLTSLSDSTGRSFMGGSIHGGRQVVTELRRVLEAAKAGDCLQPGGSQAIVVTENQTARVRRVRKTQNFYATQTVSRVAEVLDFCAEKAAIGVVTADFGAGKTEAVAAWRRAHKTDCLVFEFDEFSSSNKVDFVALLGRMLGIEAAGGSANGGRTFRMVCEALRESPCLVICDQCEVVRVRVFQVIRQIWDRTHDAGVGVVLLAAPILLTRMNNSRTTDLGALTSRVGIWAPLSGVTKSEMAAIVKAEGIADIEEGAFDLWHRATNGSMRRLMRAIDLLKAKHSGKVITEKTIVGVAGHLWGMHIDAST